MADISRLASAHRALRACIVIKVREHPTQRADQIAIALAPWKALLDANPLLSYARVVHLLEQMRHHTEPHELDNLLWLALVHSCNDDATKIWDALIDIMQVHGDNCYLIPNAIMWIVTHSGK